MTKTAKTPCYHVHTAYGHVYGVAATSKRDALQMTQDRLTRDCVADRPVTASRVDTWTAEHGTVLQYS